MEEDDFIKSIATLAGTTEGVKSCWRATKGFHLSVPRRLVLAVGFGSASGLTGGKIYAVAINRSNGKLDVAKKSLRGNIRSQ
jgi:hypothetical protein